MKKLLCLLFLCFPIFISAQNAYIELGRQLDFGNVNIGFSFNGQQSYTSDVIYNDKIYISGFINSPAPSAFPTTNSTQAIIPNSRYFFLHITDTLGNIIYSSIHYLSPDLPSINAEKINLKVNNGNVYMIFDTQGNPISTNGSLPSPNASTMLVFFSENTIQNNGNTYDYATYLGGDYYEFLRDFKIKNNNVYILQETFSTSKFITNGSQIQNSSDGYLIKISSTTIANNLQIDQDLNNYATYIGGSQEETYRYNSFEVDDDENIYLSLHTESEDIVTTNGTTVTNIGTNNHSIIYKISANSIDNDLPLNSGPSDFCSYIPNNDEDNIRALKFENGILYVLGDLIGNNLLTTGGINSTSGSMATFLMTFSTASMNANSFLPDYFHIFDNAISEGLNLQLYDGSLFVIGQYFSSNINTSDGSLLNGTADHFLCKVNQAVLTSNGNWITDSDFLISFGCDDNGEIAHHFEVNDLGIHILYSQCSMPVNLPTNGTSNNAIMNSEYYINYCLNGNLQFSTQYARFGLGGRFTARLNNSIYIYGYYNEMVEALPLVVIPSPLIVDVSGLTKITFFQPETLMQDSILPLTQTVCEYGAAEILNGENQGVINDSLPDLYYMGSTISQSSNQYSYQWQSSSTSSGPWTNISNGILEDYLPTVTTQDTYYRRLTYLKKCTDSLIASTSIVVSVLVNTNNAPLANAGVDQHTCPGAAVGLGGTSAASGGTPPYTYSWDNGLNPISNPNFTTNTNSVVTLTVTDALGCKDIDQVTIIVHQANAGTVASICNGQAVNIGSYAVQGLPGVTYSWTPTTSLSCSDCPFPLVNSTQNQTYTQTLTVPLLNGGFCQTTDQVNVTLVSGPTNPNFAGVDKTICFGSSVQLGENAESGFSYSWHPGSYLNNLNVAQPVYTPGSLMFSPIPNPSNYYLIASKNGCDFTDNVIVSEIKANAGNDGCGPRVIGVGDVTPNLNETYSWTLVSGPGSITGAINTPTTTVSSSVGGASIYQLDVSLNGVTCSDQVEVADCGCTIFQITTNSPVHCPSYLLTNDSIQLTAGPGNSNYSNLNYSWSPNTGLSSYNTQTVTLRTNSPTTYTVTITDPQDVTFYCTQQIEVNTAGWSVPVFNEVDTNLCAILPINIGTTSIPSYTYTWENFTGIFSTNSNPTVTPMMGINNYNLTVKDVNSGCVLRTTSKVVVKDFDPVIDSDWYVCENDLVQLANTVIPNAIYSWTPANSPWQNGTTSSSAQPIVLVTSDIVFTATIKDTLSGCESVKQINVFVDELPQYTALQNKTICKNETVQIGNPAVQGLIYSWSPAAGLSCTDCAQPFANPLSTTTYQVTISLPGNCANVVNKSVTVQVKGASLSLPDISFCPSNGAVNLWPNGPYNFATYRWEPSNLVSSPTISNPTSSVQSPTTFYLSAKDQDGCIVKDTILVSPSISSPNAGNNKSICLGNGNVTLGSNVNTGSIVWSPSTNLNNANSPTPIFNPTQAGTYNFTISQTINGCTAKDSVKVVVNEFSFGNLTSQLICSNSCTAIGVPNQPGSTYSWSPSTGLNSTSISNPTACPTQSTDYTLVATGINGCTNIKTVSILVSDILAPDVQITSIQACSDDITNQVNTIVQPVGNYSYQWTPSLGLSATNVYNPNVYVLGLGLTSYNLTVTDQVTGCVASDVFDFYVTNCVITPCDVPFNFIFTSDTICSGENTHISFYSDSANVVYNWSVVSNNVQGASNGTGISINQNLINSSSAIGSVTYTITPQIGSCTGLDKVFTIFVAPTPISEIVGTYAYCSGDSVLLSSLNTAFEYEWSNVDTNSSAYFTAIDNPIQLTIKNQYSCSDVSAEVNLVESLPSTTNQVEIICNGSFYAINGNQYTVAGTYTDVLLGINGCDSTVITELIVNPTYTINNAQSICQGQVYQFNGNSYSTSGSYTDILQSVSGCDSTVITDLTVNPLPVPLFVGNGEYCIGSTYTVSTTDIFASYTWSTGATSATINATTVDNPIRVTVTNNAGCSAISNPFNVSDVNALTFNSTVEICPGSSAIIHGLQQTQAGVYSETFPSTFGCDSLSKVTLVILPLPTISAGNDVVVCQGNSVTLNATGGSNYTWSGGIQNNIPFTPINNELFTVTAINSDGCIGTDEVLVTVENLVNISFNASVEEGCSPLLVTFKNTSGNLGSNCQWNLGNSTIVNGCDSVTGVYVNPGCYNVTLSSTSQAGCTSSQTTNNAICVIPGPIASFMPTPSILPSSNPTTNMSNSSQNATSYEWFFGDGIGYSQSLNPSYTYKPNEPNNYEIMLIAANEFGCLDTAYQIIQIEEDLIYFVPNTFTPDGDNFNNEFKPVFTTGFDPFDFNLKIFNRWGELIFESNNVDYGWNGTYATIDRLVQDGTYQWKIEFKLLANDARKVAVGHVTLIR